jgi:hypothetical protein
MAAAKKKAASKGVTPAELKKIALSFPETEEGTSYTHPAILASKKFFTRYRKEDNSAVLIVAGMEYRDMLLEMDPKTYFITEHYKNFPSVLVRLERVTKDEVRTMLDRRWRKIAPKKLIKAMDEKQTLSSPASARVSARGKGTQAVKTVSKKKVKKKNR